MRSRLQKMIDEKASGNSTVVQEVLFSDSSTRTERARALVFNYVQDQLDNTEGYSFAKDDVFIVWFCYILGGWKALVATTLPDDKYYEVTYNKDKRETYIDAYAKVENKVVPD